MFRYQREIYENQLAELSQEFEQKSQVYGKYQDESYYIGSYLEQKQFIFRNQLVAGLSSIIGCICLSVSIFANVTYLMYVLIAFGFTGYEIVNVSRTKRRVQRDYNDLCSVDYDEVLSRLHVANEKLYQASKEKYEVYDKIRDYREQLKKLKHYEQVSEFLTSQDGMLFSADTEAEYNALQSMKMQSTDLFQEYLGEKMDYSQIHFDNSIDKNIEYSENSKILTKKM